MHSLLLIVHSYLRWIVLGLLLLALVKGLAGWLGDKPYGPADRKVGLFATIAIDLQLLLGLALYLGVSPVVRLIMSDFGAAMKDRSMRFWAIEHISIALLAVIAVHVGRVLARRASEDRQRHKRTAIAFLLALVAVVGAIPWPFIKAIGRPLFRF